MKAHTLWDKGDALDTFIHQFTVGNDPQLDLHVAPWDIIGSAAHARMLHKVGLLTTAECAALLRELSSLHKQAVAGDFQIPQELEDCHSTIEAKLTEVLGDTGRKIHTGRSRNDQILLAMRLLIRSTLLDRMADVSTVVKTFLKRADELKQIPMPGYTHFQRAMPSSVDMWLQGFAEEFIDVLRDGLNLFDQLNSNPLGVGSGFGIPLPLDRAYTAALLGFDRVERNPMHVQNNRGQYEIKFLRWASDIAQAIEKFSCDLMLYSSQEFGFFSVPLAMTTGSSIMPQKRNPDVVELLRGSAAKIRAALDELVWVTAKLPSSYHRDFQYTKEPFVRGVFHLGQMLHALQLLVAGITPNKDALSAAMSLDLYATYDAYQKVRSGVPFRTAYQQSAQALKTGKLSIETLRGEYAAISKDLDEERVQANQELATLDSSVEALRQKISLKFSTIFNTDL